MRLERLEISGFKSFSDRAELAFDQGVTAIVGPNGCGKSNLADAITWVLGEQSAKSLRGDRMEDVIFSGSDARKPGATAEVRLRLTGLPMPPKNGDAEDTVVEDPAAGGLHPSTGARDALSVVEGQASGNGRGNGHHPDAPAQGHGNGNGHGRHETVEQLARLFTRDVEVTRRLYRSGESEYLIDGEVCRLRDVHELLMDTGLGAKAYAIIEQGKIGMILSSRPADRRQLIEEAAGITKYKSRRRAAELKLEAAQHNLTRIDDIVFEVDKQRGALKRQAAKARRYKRLREELRRWEKVLLAGRFRELARGIEDARARLAAAREREAAAAGRVAEVDADLARLRIEQAEADSRAARVREAAHARELDINRRQQQQDFDRHQAETLAARATEIGAELRDLEERRGPARLAVESRRAAAAEAAQKRDEAAALLADASGAYAAAQQRIEGLASDVEAARGGVYAVLNAATALRHAMEHAAAQRDRVAETIGKLDIERDDLRRELATVEGERTAAAAALARAQASLEQIGLEGARRESDLARARAEHDTRVDAVRARERDLAALQARLASLEELEASRAEFGDAARMVLVQANGRVGQRGAVADYVEVDRRYERAVEACLGDLLQHVIVERHDQAQAGLALVREHDAGRCGFLVIDAEGGPAAFAGASAPEEGPAADRRGGPLGPPSAAGIVPIADVLRITGPHAAAIQQGVPDAYVAEGFDAAVELSRLTPAPVATLDGDMLRGPHLVSGGVKAESRGILAAKREIKELRERVATDRESLARLADEARTLDVAIADAAAALAALAAERHRQDKAIVAHDAEVAHAAEEAARLGRKGDVIGLERRQAEEEHASLDARLAEAQASIARLLEEQRAAETHLSETQTRLMDAREHADALSARTADARAAHAAMLERTAALGAEVLRLEEGARELEERILARTAELAQARTRRAAVVQAMAEGQRGLDEDIRALEALREDVRQVDERAAELRVQVDAQEAAIREARHLLDAVRADASALDLAHATAQSDLGHLAQTCADTMQCSLDEVLGEVEQMEEAGQATPDAAALTAEEADPEAEEAEAANGAAIDASASMTADEAIAALKAKIDRLGPVNMMAIEQFDELEARHTFLTTQRKDLIDSIAQTAEAITRIDETSTIRFNEAFTAIQQNFQITFSTLFGGGRAGLTLLDENDPLESGIDIVASPPGKRLQSVQLLSGGEKALTAIALMFAIFRYKPSPFCLLDEIDAPLDDANVGRFVEMLQGMLDRTQFILITHNRRTMEIANRLYGVTMEEPGVSKLISVRLN
ncbi:MAG: chromosome segregation protein SMC [Acidobacteria bacterium]|nr:chromosome segregation protein SMC [Acidobacteriota bacterium]